MQFNKHLLICLTIATTLFCSTTYAQQDEQALMKECLKAQAEEFQPLSKERDEIYKSFSNRAYSVRNILRWLKDDPKTADVKRVKEIADLEARLKSLHEHAKLTTAEAIKNAEATIELANVAIEDIDDERNTAIKPLTRKQSALQRKYKEREGKLKPVVLSVFLKTGDSEATADLTRSYGSFSYSSGSASATYKREGETKAACTCYFYLVNEKPPKEKHGKFDNIYPIAHRTKNQLEVLVGQSRVTIYSSDKDLFDKSLDATMSGLVDFNKIEALLTP